MSKKEKKQKGSVAYHGFGGIDHAARYKEKLAADDIVNFRIRSDGSLSKREGYASLADLGEKIRALHGNTVDGKFLLYALSGSNICEIDPESGSYMQIGSTDTVEGSAHFVSFKGDIFLLDGNSIYRCSGSGSLFEKVKGYVPLIGSDWPNDVFGEINECRNLITRRAAITYTVGNPRSIYLNTKYPVESIQAIYLNGTLLSPDKYYIDPEFTTINVPGLVTSDRVTAYFTYAPDENIPSDRLLSSTSSALFGGSANNRLFLCGGNDSGYVFCSKNVSVADLEKSKERFPDSDEIYFPENYVFEVGDGINSATNMVRHYDKLLIFTEGDVWLAYPDSAENDDSPAISVNAELGCAVERGAILVGNDAASIGKNSVWIWSNDTDTPAKCKATKISQQIDDELRAFGLKNCRAFFNKNEDELWIYSELSDKVWVYNFNMEAWYKFSGFTPNNIFDVDGRIGFTSGSMIYLFDKQLSCDFPDGNEQIISAYYQSAPITFGNDAVRNIRSATVTADLFGDELTLTFCGRETADVVCIFSDGSEKVNSVIKRRITSGRFRSASFRLQTYGKGKHSIHALKLVTR